jgi:hypothetical protein
MTYQQRGHRLWKRNLDPADVSMLGRLGVGRSGGAAALALSESEGLSSSTIVWKRTASIPVNTNRRLRGFVANQLQETAGETGSLVKDLAYCPSTSEKPSAHCIALFYRHRPRIQPAIDLPAEVARAVRAIGWLKNQASFVRADNSNLWGPMTPFSTERHDQSRLGEASRHSESG